MHVGAINNLAFTHRAHTGAKRDANGKIVRDKNNKGQEPQAPQTPPTSGMSPAAKRAAMILMFTPAAVAGLNSCLKSEAYNYLTNCTNCCDTCEQVEPFIIHDTIPGNNDTVFIKPNFESPVIDTLNSIFTNLGLDIGEGVPVRLTYIDELNTKYNKHLFNGKASSEDMVIYNTNKYGWNDIQGMFNMDDYFAEKSMVMLSLAKDGNLYAQVWVPKQGVNNPQAISDYRPTGIAYKFANAGAGNVIKWIENNNDGDFTYYSVIEKGAIPNSVQETNTHGTSWRDTNIDIVSEVVPKGD